MEIVKFHKDPSEDSCLGKSLGKELDYFKNNLQTFLTCFQDWETVEDLDKLSIKYNPEEKTIIQKSNNLETISTTDKNIMEQSENNNSSKILSFWKCSILAMLLTGIHFILLHSSNLGGQVSTNF